MLDSATADWGISEKAAALHASALVWDDHGGFAYSKASILAGSGALARRRHRLSLDQRRL